MAYDASQPTASTKIRDLSTVIPANWTAIQTADSSFKPYALNLVERDSVPVAGDPTAIANAFLVYCKTDPDGNPEFFGIDENSQVIQLTQDGSLGSTNTQVNASGIAFDIDATTGLTYTDGQMVVAYGKFNSSGVLQFGKNMATAGTPHPSTGLFNVNVSADVLQTANYIISGSVSESGNSGGSVRMLMPLLTPAPVAATATTIQLEIKRDGGRTDSFDYFHIMICGGR